LIDEFSDAPKGSGFVRGYIFCMVLVADSSGWAKIGQGGKKLVN
jgi:hypothetical protein